MTRLRILLTIILIFAFGLILDWCLTQCGEYVKKHHPIIQDSAYLQSDDSSKSDGLVLLYTLYQVADRSLSFSSGFDQI